MTFQLSQFFLIGAIVIFALYAFRLRTALADRIIYLLLVSAGIVFVIHPGLSSWLASQVGIGRGADLVFYTFIVFSLFSFVTIASHLTKVERQITALVRRCAIEDAQLGRDLTGEPPCACSKVKLDSGAK